MGELNTSEQEQQVKKLKRLLEGWRMALLPLKSVILWEQQWHPCAIFGTVSFLYLLIWLMDLNTVTMFAVFGLIFNFVDFIIPIICNSIYSPTSWTGQKEKVFEEICQSIVTNYNSIGSQIRTFYSMRETSPCMYYIISVGMLCTLAWVSLSFNNVFLLYLMTLVMLLWPGIQSRGIFNTVLSMVKMGPKTIKGE